MVKEKISFSITQQLASELQFKLQQQHLLQQEHPKLLEQFKQQLEQEQICASSSFDSQSNSALHLPQANSAVQDQRIFCEWQDDFEEQEKGEDGRNTLSRRRRDRSKELSCDLPLEERFAAQKSRFKFEEGENWGPSQRPHEQVQRSLRQNGQEQSVLQLQEDFDGEVEPGAKRPKLSEQHLEGNRHVRSSLRSPQNSASGHQEPVSGVGGLHRTPKPPVAFANGLPPPPRLTSAASSAVLLDGQDARRLPNSTDPAAWNRPQAYSKPVSEGTGLRGGIAADPSSKTLGGSGNASLPGKKVLRGILDKLQKKDSYGAFAEPVDANEVPDYYDVIKEPMDFGTMRKRISANFYTSLGLFEKDIFAICSNAMTFNAAGTVYHRQARAIKAAAERILDALKTTGTAGADAILKQKVGAPHLKKSHKKKQPWKSWTSDYVAEPLSNVGGRGVGRASGQVFVADSYYVDWQGGAAQTSSKVNTVEKEDPTGYLARSLGLLDGRRWQLNEESRRSTYRHYSATESSALGNTVCGGPLQFVPAAFQLDFSYARSLARFAADLGPEVWKVAGEKIRRALPTGVPFGPGWVGQREAPGRPIVSMMNRTLPHGATNRTEHFSSEVGLAGVQGLGNGYKPGGAIGAPDCTGAIATANRVPMTSNLDCTVTSAAIDGQQDRDQLREIASLSQSAPRTTSTDSLARYTDQGMNCDGDIFQQNRPPYPVQATSEADDLHNFEGDPILIPGRDLDGRHCFGQVSATHSGLISTSGGPIDGLQSRLDEGG
ncbi:hypothetical protein GOP47_0005429 [Adiantum capillus-veneris]|uniref:Bromo domain-containing protein n=1 Tax=Adiantum capillus-veneris TaxID=13818 RepID=A0A9D4V529_ADICA|nr:hypothetical protein GOP47_0005429 [Adiantum capillus-veneris]